MRALTQNECIVLWESGRALHPLDRAVLAVQSALPDTHESVADWPIGRRNRALAQIRAAAFGALRGWAACRGCAERLEFDLDTRSITDAAQPSEADSVWARGHRYRVPTSRDLAAVVDAPDVDAAVRDLVRRCRQDVGGAVCADADIDEVSECMAAADPLAEIRVSFDCPSCGAHFEENVDLVSFLWSEIEAAAKRALAEVHALARAYGWRERDILSLSAARRDYYLKLVSA